MYKFMLALFFLVLFCTCTTYGRRAVALLRAKNLTYFPGGDLSETAFKEYVKLRNDFIDGGNKYSETFSGNKQYLAKFNPKTRAAYQTFIAYEYDEGGLGMPSISIGSENEFKRQIRPFLVALNCRIVGLNVGCQDNRCNDEETKRSDEQKKIVQKIKEKLFDIATKHGATIYPLNC